MYFLLNLEIIQFKLLKGLAQILLPAILGIIFICFADADTEEEKTNARKCSLVFCQLMHSG
jgi:hypothetical protein